MDAALSGKESALVSDESAEGMGVRRFAAAVRILNEGSGSYAILLGLLGLMWGSSFVFVKVGVETLTPVSIVALRLAVGLCILAIAVKTTACEALRSSPRLCCSRRSWAPSAS